MRLTVDQLAPFGADGGLIHFVDTAFSGDDPERVGVAVSGGGDSMALLHAAKCRADMAGTFLEATTVNHGLRPEAANEAAMVADYCAAHGIPHATLQWDGAGAAGNVAAAGREARYRLIAAWAKSRGIGGVLLGHTKDDIAETFLMRLARKSGVDGLSMMSPRFERNGVEWSRPFWQQSRADLRDYLRRHDVPWVDDPTNEDMSYERPKARQILKALAPLGVSTDVVKSVAMSMHSASSALQYYAREEARRTVSIDHGDVVIKRNVETYVPQEVERRIWVAALRFLSGDAYAPRTTALDELTSGLSRAGKHTLSGCIVTQDDRSIRFSREHNAVRDTIGKPNEIWDGRWMIEGPDRPNLRISALGERLSEVPDWRQMGLPRSSLMATPAVFDDETLISAPIAGLYNGFEARIVTDFSSFLLSR
ncbi:tRNA lysidine(34) synthetase TilS [Octadecabacter sp.]|nr:tRNA lysidine(34) synthetase TilS [Octadecabacter sp.]